MTRRSVDTDVRDLLKRCSAERNSGDLEAAFRTAQLAREKVLRAIAYGHTRARRLAMLVLAAESIVSAGDVCGAQLCGEPMPLGTACKLHKGHAGDVHATANAEELAAGSGSTYRAATRGCSHRAAGRCSCERDCTVVRAVAT